MNPNNPSQKHPQWTDERIRLKIEASVDRWRFLNQQEYRQIRSVLKKQPQLDCFGICWAILTQSERPKTRYLDQEFAGQLLFELNPPCPLSPEAFIEGLLPLYDLSLEQIPWYAADQFGLATVNGILTALLAKQSTGSSQQAAKTWLYWLRGNPIQPPDGQSLLPSLECRQNLG